MAPEVAASLRVHEDRFVNVVAANGQGLAAASPESAPATSLESAGPDRVGSAGLLWRESLHRRLLGVADVTSAAVAAGLVLGAFDQRRAALSALVGAALVLLVFKLAGLYDRDQLRLAQSTLDDVPLLAQLTGLFALCVAILQNFVLERTVSADQIAALWVASFGGIVMARMIARAVTARSLPAERCLVIGDDERTERIREKLASARARAVVIASLPLDGSDIEHIEWIESIESPGFIRDLVRDLNINRIIIAPTTTDTAIVDLIRVAKAAGVRVSVLPRMFEVVGSAVEFDDVDGMTMLGVRSFGFSRSGWLIKRAFDVVMASIGLIAVSPILSAIAVAISLDSSGPIFFGQVRVGREGRHFRMFKFRSMIADADKQKDSLRALNEAGDGLFKLSDDPRVTRVGRFLRRTSLDELPQLFNVLRGEMSLVGPRPLVVDEDAQVVGLDRSRLHLTPGMTGPWQVLGSRVPMQEMVGIDYLYVANWSLWLDIKILLRTVRHVARRTNL
jgi:exopolysaccharide biosynthesis polyprenyl glycosylphosphotransferase